MRRWMTLVVWSVVLGLFGPGRISSGLDTPSERGHRLTPEEAAAGWISLFDGSTTFGWSGARCTPSRLVGGTTSAEFGDCELRGDFDHGGTLIAGGNSVAVKTGRFVIGSTGRRGPIQLSDGASVTNLVIRPLGLRPLFDGRSLTGCTTMRSPGAKPGTGPNWTLVDQKLHAKGGPGAMELPGRFGDFLLQVEVRTRGVHANGGVFFRNPPGTCMMGYEAQVYNRCEGGDPTKPALYATGAVDDRQNARRLVSRDNEFFTMTVLAQGPHIATWVNGFQVTDWTDTRPRNETPRRGLRTEAGTIQLQAHDPDTDIEFGVIAIAPLSHADAVAKPIKELILPGESFVVSGRPAFILTPPEDQKRSPRPWIFYAPTLPGLPDAHEKWMHEQFLAAGVAVAGIDVGEAYGGPSGRELYTALYHELTENRGFASRPCLLGRSRGGLLVMSWAAENPEKVAGLAGIYPVFDLRSYPGVDKAASAYDLTPTQLEARLGELNPIERVALLARHRVPALVIHGDVDQVVPLEKNSAAFVARYRAAGAADAVTLITAKGQGHSYWEGFFRCRELVDFAINRARSGAAP
jgi:Domain of Unknown Function (DUF1080)/Prolyl oligopeptidase family